MTKYNLLTWIKKTEERNKRNNVLHLFECECGERIKRPFNRVSSGHIKSCGCLRKPNEIGRIYGVLKVKKESGRTRRGDVQYSCECKCGEEIIVEGYRLRNGSITSCGCRNENALDRIPVGTVLNELTVGKYKIINGRGFYECRCECGRTKLIRVDTLKNASSCGDCKKSEASKTHGMSNTRLYVIYGKMKSRTSNENDDSYKYYGGRGINLCQEWADNPISFIDWALKNGYQDDLSIDRIDFNGDYEPSNCRWVSYDVQANNRRSNIFLTYDGMTKTASQWANYFGVDRQNALYHLRKGRSFEESFKLVERCDHT